ncbi:hypothetical protein B0I37DRAFT_445965 [Chaetomium sp. MPI-CAGE-AT-0009]|nr:hypothetical protein B0I37DRAFT_445965 [Chaetomium sp. MPI-CAGE-AT-0009]
MNDSKLQPGVYYPNEDALEAAKQLKSQPKKEPEGWEPIRPSPCVILLSVSFFTFAACSIATWAELVSGPYPFINECDNTENISAAEMQFQINIRAASGLSFTQAKVIDLAWDLGVAHGGRLLHGWILYHIACKTITWSLEHASLPYHFLLSLLFWPDSVWSLWSSIKYLAGKRQPGILVAMVLLTYSIAHVLFFSALWSAMTGYQGVGRAVFMMPGSGSWVASDNDTLRLCWSLDPKRLSPLPADGVVLGPKFGSVFQSFSDLDAVSGTGKMWDSYHKIAGGMSDDFNNIYSYARSRFTMQSFLGDFVSESSQEGGKLGEVPQWNRFIDIPFEDFNNRGFQNVEFSYNTSKQPSEEKLELPLVVNGWQFLGVGQDLSTSPEELVLVTYQPSEPHNHGTTQFLEANFHLDTSVPSTPDVIPYNSTVWYNGTKIALQAPFLDLGSKSCSWSGSLLGECICYEGKPLTEDFRLDSNRLCIGSDQYMWGFSRSLLFIGLTLEAIWCFVCLILHLLSTQRSNLVRQGRPTVGVIRTILDLSEALNRDLGPDTSWYTEKELEKKISGHHPVGYTIWDKDDVKSHIGLVPLAKGESARRRLLVEDFRTV